MSRHPSERESSREPGSTHAPSQERARLLFSTVPAALLANTALVILLAMVQWTVVTPSAALAWVGLALLTLVVRAGIYAAYRRASPREERQWRQWLLRFRTGVFATGVAWGFASLLMFPAGELSHQVFLAFVIAGVSAGAASYLAVDRVSILGFMGPALLPLILAFALAGEGMPLVMGLMVAIFLVFVLLSSTRAGQQFEENESLRGEARAREETLQQHSRLLQISSRAQSQFIHEHDRRRAFDELLADILDLSSSEYGFIGEVLRTAEGTPYVKTYAITNIAWNDATRSFYDANASQGMEFFNLNTLFGAALSSGEPVIANDPSRDPRSGGLPEGHPALSSFLGIPIHHGDELVAMLGLANRPGGYDQAQLEFLQPLLVTIGQLTEAARVHHRHDANLRELARLSQVASQTTNGVVITDAVGRVEWVNEGFARITGYTLDEIRGQKPADLLQGPATDLDTVATMRAALARGESFQVDIVNYTKSGLPYWIRINCNPLWGAGDELQGFMAIESDVTEQKQAEKNLRETSRFLEGILENVPSMIFLKDAKDLRFRFFNRAGEKLIGHGREEVIGRNDYDFFSREQADFFTGKDRAVLSQTDVIDIPQEKIDTPQGERILHTRKLALRDEQGNPQYLLGISEDITESVEAVEALDRQRWLYEQIIEQSMAGYWDWSLQQDTEYLSPAFKKMFGYEDHEMQNRPESWQKIMFPEDLPGVLECFEQHVESHGQVPFDNTVRYQHKNGSTVWIRCLGKVIEWAPDGQPARMVGCHIDVTGIKQFERALQLNESRLRGLFELAPIGIALNDYETGAFVDANAALLRSTCYTREEFIDLSYWQITPREYEPQEKLQLESMERTGRYGPYQKEYIRKDGSRYPVVLNGMVVYDSTGRKLIWTIAEDVTERKRTERMQNEFISTVSHELRTPLTSIVGALGLIAGGGLGELSQQAQQMVSIAYKNSQRLTRLINDLLDIEKLAAGKLHFEMQEQPLMPLIDQALDSHQTYGVEKEVGLLLEKVASEARVRVDSQRLQQVLANLLSNAIKFSPAKGTVGVSVQQVANLVRVIVTDQGPGIPEAFRARVFEKFSQADSSDTRQIGGTGLGLAITRDLVERMGGRVGFDSVEGEGASFWFELPLAGRDPTAMADDGELLALPGGPRILVVEDDPDVAEVLTALLTRSGYRVDVAHTGQQALTALTKVAYDVLSLDLVLPDMGGIEIIRQLRQQPHTAELPIVVLSARMEEGQLAINGDFSGIDWLAKPIDERRMLKTIEALLGASRNTPQRVLHVEDDPDLHQVIRSMVGERFDFELATTLQEARPRIALERFDVVILDLGLPDGSGWDLLPEIRVRQPDAQVVILTGTDMTAEDAHKVEAVLLKSRVSPRELLDAIRVRVRAFKQKGGAA